MVVVENKFKGETYEKSNMCSDKHVFEDKTLTIYMRRDLLQ